MNFSREPSLPQNLESSKEWQSLSIRMSQADGVGFSADTTPEELHRSYHINYALARIEEAARHISSEDETVRLKAVEDVLQNYSSEGGRLRREIGYYAQALASDGVGGTEPFAYAARLMVTAATTIALAARKAHDTATLNELQASLEAAISGLDKVGRSDADALSLVLRRQLSWLFT